VTTSNPRNFVFFEGNRIAVQFEPDSERIESLRKVCVQYQCPYSAGELWRATLPLTAKDDVARLFSLLQWSDAFRRMMRGAESKFTVAAPPITDRILARLGNLSEPVAEGLNLYHHQIEGVEWLARVPRGILADDMGLGKTLQSLLCARAVYEEAGAHTVVITKACLISDWRKEAARIRHRVVSCYSWAKIPAPTPGQKYVLIADEAQYAQNTDSIRGKAFQEWARAAEWVWMLTGTPMMNGQHSNLFALIKALRHPLAANKKEFERVFCGSKRIVLDHRFKIDDEKFLIFWTCSKCGFVNRQRWNYAWKSYTCGGCADKVAAPKTFIEKSGAKNAAELKRQLAPFILRRLKTECLDLPPKTRIIREIEVSNDALARYEEAIRTARARYAEKVANGQINKSGEALAILTTIRIAASVAKVASAIELGEEALEEGLQPVIFFEFVESVKLVAAHFKITPYIGTTHKDTKPRLVENFQDRMQKVFAGTREAGGTGLTLTAGNVVILGDRPLRPGEVDQAEDRLLRIGQNWPVTSYWLRAFPVCHKIDGYLARKQKAIDAFLGGGQGDEVTEKDRGAREVLRDLFG
jgi:SNF2 family DNA or RNA helicase